MKFSSSDNFVKFFLIDKLEATPPAITKLYDLEDNNSKLNNDIQMIIIEDTDLVNQLNQKEDQIAILKDQLEQKNEDSSWYYFQISKNK